MGRIRVTRNSTTNYATTADIVAGSNVTITEAVTGDVMTLTIAASGGGGGGTPASTVVSEQSFGQSPAVGTSTDYARGDHSHGTPTIPLASSVVSETAFGQSAAIGTSSNVARQDHTHGTPAVPAHSALSSLAWTSSGHTGTAQSVAVFNGGGAAAVSTPSADGQVLSRQGGALVWITLSTGFAFFPELTDVRVNVEPIVSLGLTFTPSAGTL
jgi:hypothetical protein